jgi:MFS family permease
MNNSEPPAPLLCELPPSAIHRRIVALAFAAWIFDFYDLVLYSFLLVPVARDLGLTPAQSSLALGTSLLATAVGGVTMGIAGDRWGRRPAIAASVAIFGVGTLLSATAHSIFALIAYRAITGFGMGGGWAPGQSLVAETMPPARRARYAGFVQTGAPLGVMLAAAAGGFLAPRIGWRLTFAISALPAFVVMAAVIALMPESDIWQRNRHRVSGALTRIAEAKPYRKLIALIFIIVLLNSEAYWFTYSWMPAYLQIARHLSAAGAGRLMIRMQVGGVFGYLAFGYLADRYGRRSMFSLFASTMAIGLLAPTIFWEQAARIPHLIAISMIAAGFGTGVWAGMAPMIAEMMPTSIRNTALGAILNIARGFQFFTPIAITALSTTLGFGATLSIGAAFSAVGAAMVWMLPETRGRRITDLD